MKGRYVKEVDGKSSRTWSDVESSSYWRRADMMKIATNISDSDETTVTELAPAT